MSLVHSEKGHGGGWTITCDFATTTLGDIYDALGRPEIMAMGNRTEAPGCLVEQAVNAVLGDTFAAAEALLLTRFGEVTLADLRTEFHNRFASRTVTPTLETKHAV
ncbi:Rrf2 family transcriptional regulator [Acetobacter fabarum]|uniref:Rrf2 family transcriptional regulator n=1 Tax=Acetobacter fabarum TaxID=483199 RepID=UPI00312B90F9